MGQLRLSQQQSWGLAMKTTRSREILSRVYDELHAALWAGLAAFLIFFIVIIVPKLLEARARAESQRILDIAAEHNFYCDKWGMGVGTKGYAQCIRDLQAFRANVEKRIAGEMSF